MALFRAFFNLVKIRQKKFENKFLGEFWEKILKIFEKWSSIDTPFFKNQKIVKKKVEFTEISKIVKKR